MSSGAHSKVKLNVRVRPSKKENSHEDTKGHELHVAPDSDPDIITFPGMVKLWERFWSEIPKSELEVN